MPLDVSSYGASFVYIYKMNDERVVRRSPDERLVSRPSSSEMSRQQIRPEEGPDSRGPNDVAHRSNQSKYLLLNGSSSLVICRQNFVVRSTPGLYANLRD